MNASDRKYLEHRIIQIIEDGKKTGNYLDVDHVLDKYISEISKDISTAVGELNDISSLFLVSMFECYAERIRHLYPNIKEDSIKCIKSIL